GLFFCPSSRRHPRFSRDGSPDVCSSDLRPAYGDPPETDALTAAIADVLLGRGEVERAERVVGNVTGPRTYLVRGRIALGRGDVAGARHALLAAASGLDGPDATEALSSEERRVGKDASYRWSPRRQ